MKKIISAVLITTVLAGCAGRTPMPMMTMQAGDNKKSCAAIQNEMMMVENDIHRLQAEGGSLGKNIAWGIGGLFFWPLLFGLDLKGAQESELSAAQQRRNVLMGLAGSKNCDGEV